MNQSAVQVVSDHTAIRLLSDPYKRKILREFVSVPRTAKQVTERLGVKPPSLYHHVRQLEEAGLLVLVEERQKRGTTERYLLTPGKRFLVRSDSEEDGGFLASLGTAFDSILADAASAAVCSDSSEAPFPLINRTVRMQSSEMSEFAAAVGDLLHEYEDPEGIEVSVMLTVVPSR